MSEWFFRGDYILTKVYLPEIVELNPLYATIDNEISMKIRAILFWPLSYLILLIKLSFLHAMK